MRLIYCTQYHCAGDCGTRHARPTDLSAYKRKKLTLAAFDELESDEQRLLRERRAEVERAAREAL